MQNNRIHEMLEDAHIHIDNIISLLANRGLLDPGQK